MPRAEPQQRRRPEQLRIAETALQLFERPRRVGLLRPGHDDADEMAERRIAERTAALELARDEALDVVACCVRDRAGVRLERLHDHAAGGVAAAPPGKLRQQLKRALLRAEVRQ